MRLLSMLLVLLLMLLRLLLLCGPSHPFELAASPTIGPTHVQAALVWGAADPSSAQVAALLDEPTRAVLGSDLASTATPTSSAGHRQLRKGDSGVVGGCDHVVIRHEVGLSLRPGSHVSVRIGAMREHEAWSATLHEYTGFLFRPRPGDGFNDELQFGPEHELDVGALSGRGELRTAPRNHRGVAVLVRDGQPIAHPAHIVNDLRVIEWYGQDAVERAIKHVRGVQPAFGDQRWLSSMPEPAAVVFLSPLNAQLDGLAVGTSEALEPLYARLKKDGYPSTPPFVLRRYPRGPERRHLHQSYKEERQAATEARFDTRSDPGRRGWDADTMQREMDQVARAAYDENAVDSSASTSADPSAPASASAGADVDPTLGDQMVLTHYLQAMYDRFHLASDRRMKLDNLCKSQRILRFACYDVEALSTPSRLHPRARLVIIRVIMAAGGMLMVDGPSWGMDQLSDSLPLFLFFVEEKVSKLAIRKYMMQLFKGGGVSDGDSQEEAGSGPSRHADQHGQSGVDSLESRAVGCSGKAGRASRLGATTKETQSTAGHSGPEWESMYDVFVDASPLLPTCSIPYAIGCPHAYAVARQLLLLDDEPIYFEAKTGRAVSWRLKCTKVSLLFEHMQIDLEFIETPFRTSASSGWRAVLPANMAAPPSIETPFHSSASGRRAVLLANMAAPPSIETPFHSSASSGR
ncbi:hypothetical protein GQ44DRAFT_765057 [Phaeosphaeriaceae sp. PMI808]|nr:hypothetical protein GQ44DRAFT_765057 [Phaeosphaeriaceae sp. PMI808]